MEEKAKILVVDDESAVCKSIHSILAQDGHTVDMAFCGMEALEKRKKTKYDVIITDIKMPGIDGMYLLHALLAKKPDMKVIMITGYPSIRSAVEAIKTGAFSYLPKPFTPNELRSQVSRALKSKRFHEENEEISLPMGFYCIPENSWVRLEKEGQACIGVTHIFLNTIGKIISIDDMPEENEVINQGDVFLRITDSHKHIHKVWAPVGGKIVIRNETIKKNFECLTSDPYGEGWVIFMTPTRLKDDLNNLVFIESL